MGPAMRRFHEISLPSKNGQEPAHLFVDRCFLSEALAWYGAAGHD